MTYETAKIIPFKPCRKKEPSLCIVPNPAYQVSKIDLVFTQKAAFAERPCIRSSEDAYQAFMLAWDQSRLDLCEEAKVMYLNRAHYLLSIYDHAKGGISGVIMDPRHILLGALYQNATTIILAHNHPSQNLAPSKADELLTAKVRNAAGFHDITLADHLIVTRNGYRSFADEGIMP